MGLESTILDCRTAGEICILRPGAIGADMLHKLLSAEYSDIKILTNTQLKETTPGAVYRHYAPYTAVKIISTEQAQNMAFSSYDVIIGCDEEVTMFEGKIQTINLGSAKDTEYIARHLYNNFQKIDDLKISTAWYIKHTWGTSDIELAIANRLEKAFALFT